MFSHRGGLFGGNEFAGGGGFAPTEEVVNNYYDSPGGTNAGLGPVDDRTNNFADPGDLNQVDDNQIDDNQADDSQYDDDSQTDDSALDTDDGGGFDSGSDDSWA